MSVLLARMILRDGSNEHTLDVRRGENRELILQLAFKGCPGALSNMQPKVRPPAFCESDYDTVNAVERWVGQTLYRLVEIERGPTAVIRED